MLTVPLEELRHCVWFFAHDHHDQWLYADLCGVKPRRVAEIIAETIDEDPRPKPQHIVDLVKALRIGEADFLIALYIDELKEDL